VFDLEVWKVAILTQIKAPTIADFWKREMPTVLALEKEPAVVQVASE
jgi:hypothetical protein